MKKHLIASGIVIILLAVGLCGCNEKESSNINSNSVLHDIEVIDVSVKTSWVITGDYPNKETFYESGFYHDYPNDAKSITYIINATFKNNLGRLVTYAQILMLLYDINGNILYNEYCGAIANLPNSYTDTHSFRIPKMYKETYFDYIESVDFEIYEL